MQGVQILSNQAGGARMGYTIFGTEGVAPTLTSTTSRHYERYKIGDKYTVYADVLNVFDISAPFDPSAAYALFQFNPAWAGPNIMGRYFRLGAKFDF